VTRELGGYSAGTYQLPVSLTAGELPTSLADRANLTGMRGRAAPSLAPGLCRPWELKAAECPPITGDKDLIRQVWNDIEGLANTYIWQLLLSF